MPTIADLAAEYAQEDRPTGIIIDDAQVVRQLIAPASMRLMARSSTVRTPFRRSTTLRKTLNFR